MICEWKIILLIAILIMADIPVKKKKKKKKIMADYSEGHLLLRYCSKLLFK